MHSPMVHKILCLLAALCTAFSVSAGQLVVLESTAEKYPVGSIIESTDVVELSQDEKLSLLSDDGGSLVAVGPMEGLIEVQTADGSWSNGLAKISSFLSNRQASRAKLGAVRAFVSDELVPSGAVDVTEDGVYCFHANTTFRFWRPSTHSGDSNFTLQLDSDGQLLSGFWAGDDRFMNWPPGFGIPYGRPIELVLSSYDTFAEVIIFKIPNNVVAASNTMVWMIDNGCNHQVAKWLGVP